MSICFYYKNNVKINSIQELITEFFKDNNQLKNASIFSSEEIQDSTYKKLLAIPGINTFEKSTVPLVTEYIVQQNPGRYAELGIDTKDGRLVPEYIKENRIYSFIKENLKLVDNLSDNIDVTNIKYDSNNLEALRKNDDLSSLSNNKLIILLEKIENIMLFEEKVKDFGILIHKIISFKSQNKPYDATLNSYLNDPKNSEVLGNFNKDSWFTKIEEIAENVLRKVSDDNRKVISEISIVTDTLKGKIDLIAIDSSGSAHIYEIKISKTKYKDWDSAKKITLDRQLSLYRQLLGQHIMIDDTMLITIPIWMDGLGDPSRIHIEEFADRKSENHSGLGGEGKFTREANLILPRKIMVDFDPERVEKLKNDLHQLIPDFKIETGIDDFDVKKLMDKARERYKKEKVWKFYNNSSEVPGLKEGIVEAETEELLQRQIELYVKHTSKQINRNVSILKDSITSAIKNKTRVKTNAFDIEKDITVNHLLFEFLNGEWDVIHDIPEALAMGLIILKNKNTGNVNVISLTSNALYADSNIENNMYGDLEYLKTFLFINEFKKELFPGGSGKLAQIIVYNPINKQSFYVNALSKYNSFNKRMYKQGLDKKLSLKSTDVLKIEDIALYNLNVNFRNFSGTEQEKETIDSLFSKFEGVNLADIDLQILLDIQKEFYETFPEYKLKSTSTEINFSDQKEMIAALLNVAISSKNGMELSGDFQNLSTYSLGFSDFRSLVAALYTNKQSEYDKTGKKIQGILGGLVWVTPDWAPSKDLKNINKIMSTANQHIGEWMVNVSEKIYTNTKEYYNKIKFSETEQNWSGETQSKYENLWLHKNNKVADDFKTKNPYMDDLENQLLPEERSYLKKMLLIINTWKLEITESDINKLDSNNLSSILSNSKIKKAIEDGSYFEMPLIRREEITRFKGAITNSGKLWKDKIKPFLSEINDYLDTRELQKGDLDTIALQKMGFYEMYDVYGRQTQEFKAKAIEEKSITYFEWNLDTIAHRVAFNKIRKKILDKKLPIINSYIWWIKLLAGKQNIDISKQLEYITNQMKLSVYDEPIIDEEFKDYSIVVAVVKQISTAGMLAFKPASFVKEMTVGIFKGISLAATKMYGKDQFGVTDLLKAYQKLITIDNKFANEHNLIDKLNHYYRFANMDVNSISKKLQTDRRGLFRGLGRYMYMCNTIPDYYNRLSILLAKMIHDGSYEAHSLINGEFKYDATKDDRFSYYLKNRENHKLNNTFIAATNDRKYNEQRQKYLLLISQLNIEYKGEQVFEESDIVNKAYSEIERSSLKSFSDMSYGYYDKDAQSQASNLWWGMTWLQFMQFWPGKMKQWFAKPTDESPMGKIEQEFVIDESGNKKLQWRKTIIDDEGNINIEITDEDTGDPSLRWIGTPYEGLMYSILGTLKDVATLDFKNIKNSEERNRRVMFALTDAILIFILLSIAKAFYTAYISDNGTEGISGTLIGMSAAVNNKVLNEYNIYKSTLGAVNTEPVFLSWSKKLAGDTYDTLSGDKELMDLLKRNVGAAEVFKW